MYGSVKYMCTTSYKERPNPSLPNPKLKAENGDEAHTITKENKGNAKMGQICRISIVMPFPSHSQKYHNKYSQNHLKEQPNMDLPSLFLVDTVLTETTWFTIAPTTVLVPTMSPSLVWHFECLRNGTGNTFRIS